MPDSCQEFENLLNGLTDDCPAVLDHIAQVRCLLAGDVPAVELALAVYRLGVLKAEQQQAVYFQDMQRGRKVLESARLGHAVVHGTPEQRLALYATYQSTANRLHEANPALSWTALSVRVGREYGCTGRTIRRHTINPKKKMGHCPALS